MLTKFPALWINTTVNVVNSIWIASMLRLSFQARENPRKVLVIDAENDHGRTARNTLVSFWGHRLLEKQFILWDVGRMFEIFNSIPLQILLLNEIWGQYYWNRVLSFHLPGGWFWFAGGKWRQEVFFPSWNRQVTLLIVSPFETATSKNISKSSS